MRIAAFTKKFISPVAVLVSALLAFTGIAPASAAGAVGASNTGISEIASNWTIGSSSTATLENIQSQNWTARYITRSTALVGKTLSMTGGITPAITGGTAYVGASLNYYKADGSSTTPYSYGNMSGTSNGGSDYQAVVPADTARIEINLNFSYSSNTMNGAVIPTLGTAYTPTFTIKVDGVTQTLSNTWSGTEASSTTDIHLASQPVYNQISKSGSFTGNSAYSNGTQTAFTCVDLSTLATGDVLKIRPIVDGTDKYGDYTYSFDRSWRNVDSGSYNSNYTQQDVTVTSEAKAIGGQLLIQSRYWRGSGSSVTGAKSFAISIQNAAGTELNVDCAMAPLAQSVVPTLAVSGSYLALSVTDPSFANRSWVWNAYKTSDNSLLGSGTGNGNTGSRMLQVCGQTGCNPIAPAGVQIYVKVALSSNFYSYNSVRFDVSSPLSAKSNDLALPDPWISVSPAVSGGTAPGDASVISSNIDYAAAAQDPTYMLPTSPQVSDGNNGVLKPIATMDFGNGMPVVTYKLFRIGAAGIDSTFAGSGATGVTIGTSGPSANVYTGWFGARNKWTSVIRDMNYSSQIPTISWKIVQGTFSGSTVSTPVTKTQTDLNTYCGSLVSGSTIGAVFPISAPTADPLYSVSCSKQITSGNTSYMANILAYVKIAADGTLSTVAQLNTGDGVTDSSWISAASVANVNASASSDVAFTLVGYTTKWVSQTQSDVVTRKGIQIKVDGSVTNVANAFTSTATTQQTEKTYLFSRTALGAATTGFQRTFAAGVTTYKWASLSAAGVITEGDAVALDAIPDFNITSNGSTVDGSVLTFVDGQEVGTGGKIQMRRSLGLTKTAAVTVDLDAKTFDTGEVVSYTNSVDPRVIQFTFVDDQGRLNWMFTSANNVLSLIRWNGVNGSGGSLPAGVTVTKVSTSYITNAAAAVTLTGTGLNLITGRLTVGGILVTPTTKTATSLVFTIPTGTVAGPIDIVAPFAAGAATLGSVNRIGANKQDQSITDVADVNQTWSGVSSKVTATFPALTDKGLATTIKVDKAAVCSVTGQVVTMNAAGTCVVTVSAAGDLGTNTATNQTTTIVVAPRTQNVTSILTALAAAAGTWAGVNQTVALPGVLSSVGLAATITVAPATVCTYAAGVLTLKAAGTCAVSVTAAADAGTPAVAKTVQNVVIAKGDLALTAVSTLTLSNNPADISGDTLNVRSVNADVADVAASLVDFTFASNNEDICTVDDDGNVTGVAIGTCVITTDAEAGANWAADEVTTTVTVADSSTVVDVLPEVGDGELPAKAIANNKSAFVATNDPSLLVKWDKAAGLLTLQAKGVYIGFIKAEITFTAPNNGGTFTCTNVFGTTAPLASKTAAQKKAALKSKVYTAAAAACKDASGLSVPDSISAVADFAKIKKVAKDTKAANTVAGSTKYEALAQSKLKGFAGTMTIKVTRYRAWPTTMKNKAGSAGTGKGIPATVRTTVLNLQ